MATLSSRLVVSLMDRTGAGTKTAMSNMARLKAMAAGTTTVMRRQGRTMRALRTIGGSGGGMAGLGAAAAAAGFLKNELDVQTAMNRTQAILNETNEKSFKPHRDLVTDLAKKYPTTSAEIAKGASELAMSGMNLKQVNEVLEATVQGSMASGESIKTVGMGVTDVVMGLGKALTKSNFLEVNDVLAAAATSYAQDYTQFLSGLAKTAPLARVTGTSLRDVTGMLGALANAGFKAEKGGTALRTMMINLGAPTAKAMAQFKKFKINLEDFRGKFDAKSIGGKKGAKTLGDMLFEQGLDIGKSKSAVQKILSNKNLLGSRDKLHRALFGTISKQLGIGRDGPSAKMLTEGLNSFLLGGFKSLDVKGLFKALGETGAMSDLTALKAIFGKRFSAQAASIMAQMFTKVKDENGKLVSVFDKAMNTFEGRIPGAVQRFAKILMKGLPGAIKRLGGAFDGLMRAMANSGAIDVVSNAFGKLRDGINSLSETSPRTLKYLTLLGLAAGLLMPLGFAAQGLVATFTLLAGAAKIAAVASMFLGRSLLLRAPLAIWAGVATSFGLIATRAKAARAAMVAMTATSAASSVIGAPILVPGRAGKLRALGAAILSVVRPMKLLALAGKGLMAATGIGALLLAFQWIVNNAKGIGQFFSGFAEGFMGALGPAVPLIRSVGSGLSKIVEWIGKIAGPLDESGKKWRSWGKAVGAAIAAPFRLIGKLFDKIMAIGRWIANTSVGRWVGKKFGLSSDDLTTAPSPAAAANMVARVPGGPGRARIASAMSDTTSVPSVAAAKTDVAQVSAQAQAITVSVQQSMDQVRAIIAGVDLTSEGERMMNTLATGIRRGTGAVRAATQSAVNDGINGALRGAYSDGAR